MNQFIRNASMFLLGYVCFFVLKFCDQQNQYVLKHFTKFPGKHQLQSPFQWSCRLQSRILPKRDSITGIELLLLNLKNELLYRILQSTMLCSRKMLSGILSKINSTNDNSVSYQSSQLRGYKCLYLRYPGFEISKAFLFTGS